MNEVLSPRSSFGARPNFTANSSSPPHMNIVYGKNYQCGKYSPALLLLFSIDSDLLSK